MAMRLRRLRRSRMFGWIRSKRDVSRRLNLTQMYGTLGNRGRNLNIR
jgi:hypothetical protein